MRNLEDLVRFIVDNLVENKESIEIKTEENERTCVLTILVNKEDIGKVIGRDGKIARSIRTIVKSASAKLNKKYIVKIGERD